MSKCIKEPFRRFVPMFERVFHTQSFDISNVWNPI